MIKTLKKIPFVYRMGRSLMGFIRLLDWNFIHIRRLQIHIDEREEKIGKVVLAGSVGANPDMLMQTIVGLGFKQEKYEVYQLICDAALPICYNAKQYHFSDLKSQKKLAEGGLGLACTSCTLKSKLYQASAKFQQISYSNLVPEASDIEHIIGSIDLDAAIYDSDYRKNFKYKNVHVLEHTYSAVVRFFASNRLDNEKAVSQIFEAYLKASIITTEVIAKTLNKLKNIDAVICDHGIYVPQGIITEFCKFHKIRIITFNTGYRKNSFLFAEGDSYHFAIPEDVKFLTKEYSDQARETAYKYVVSRSVGSNDWVYFQEKNKIQSIDLGTDTTNVAIFPNVLWDADIHFKAALFKNASEWINETLEYLTKKTNATAHVRIHPGELKGFVKSRIKVIDIISPGFKDHPRVKIYDSDHEINSYSLAQACNVSIVQGSKIGIDLAALGEKVLVAGDCWTRDKNITYDPKNKIEYFDALSKLDNIYSNQKRAKDFAYYLYFEKMKVLQSVSRRKGDPPFKFDSNIFKNSEREQNVLASIVKEN